MTRRLLIYTKKATAPCAEICKKCFQNLRLQHYRRMIATEPPFRFAERQVFQGLFFVRLVQEGTVKRMRNG